MGPARSLFTRARHDSDERGAVMVSGVFMASFLVGALWYLMGIGEAIVFRDRMQEAADHAAFTSAALHAKGMNFIAACNIIMLVAVLVHIVLGIIHDVALAVCIASLGTTCGAWADAKEDWESYTKFIKPALTVTHYVEMGAGYGYPWLGSLKGHDIGAAYGKKGRTAETTVVPLSASMIPGDFYDGAKTGLPLKAQGFDSLCSKLAGTIYDWTTKNVPLAKQSLLGGLGSAIFGGDTADMILKRILGVGITLRYCNSMSASGAQAIMDDLDTQLKRGEKGLDANNADIKDANKTAKAKPGDPGYQKPTKKPMIDHSNKGTGSSGYGGWTASFDPGFDKGWGTPGPYVVMTGVENGHDAMSVWAINVNPRFKDVSERRVKIASRPLQSVWNDTDEGPSGYFAQAEFYYDCEERWTHASCNGDNNTMYSLKWRARLRRLDLPNLGEILGSFTMDAGTNTEAYKSITGVLGTNNAFYDVFTKGPFGALGIGVLRATVGGFIKQLETKIAKDLAGAIGPGGTIDEVYH